MGAVASRLHVACHLQLDDDQSSPIPFAEAIRSHLRQTAQPCSRTALRQHLRANNVRLGDTLRQLEQHGLIVRAAEGWTLTNT